MIHYAKLNEAGEIIEVFGTTTELNTSGIVPIMETEGRDPIRLPLLNVDGSLKYYYDGEAIRETKTDNVLTEEAILTYTTTTEDHIDTILQLEMIDFKSIRPIREYLASLEGAPQVLKDLESRAVALRSKL